jgi:hypothetical protein
MNVYKAIAITRFTPVSTSSKYRTDSSILHVIRACVFHRSVSIRVSHCHRPPPTASTRRRRRRCPERNREPTSVRVAAAAATTTNGRARIWRLMHAEGGVVWRHAGSHRSGGPAVSRPFEARAAAARRIASGRTSSRQRAVKQSVNWLQRSSSAVSDGKMATVSSMRCI